MTQPIDDQIGGALGRLNRRTARTYEIITDGIGYRPSHVIEELASELGYAKARREFANNEPTVDDLYPPFVRDQKRAGRTRDYRRRTFLRVLALAGGDPDDIAAVLQAFGLEPRDSEFADRIDDHNAQVRQHWIDEFQRGQAIAIANARRDEHRKTVEQVHAELNSDTPAPDLSGPSMSIASAYYAENGQTVTVRGVLAGVSKRTTRQGRDWASATVRDGRSQIEVLVFPNRYEGAEALLVDGADVVVVGRLDRRDGPAQIMAASIQVAGAIREALTEAAAVPVESKDDPAEIAAFAAEHRAKEANQ